MIKNTKNQSGAALVGVVLILFALAFAAFLVMMSLSLPFAAIQSLRELGRTFACTVEQVFGGECKEISGEKEYGGSDYERIFDGTFTYDEACSEKGCIYDRTDKISYPITNEEMRKYQLVLIPKEISVQGKKLYATERVVASLEAAYREKPIFKVNNAFRSIEHNKAVGGDEDSNHLRGEAIDIAPSGSEYVCTNGCFANAEENKGKTPDKNPGIHNGSTRYRFEGCNCSQDIVDLMNKFSLKQTDYIFSNDSNHFSLTGG